MSRLARTCGKTGPGYRRMISEHPCSAMDLYRPHCSFGRFVSLHIPQSKLDSVQFWCYCRVGTAHHLL